jgi:outer membrane protein assembly factor BamB
MKKLFILYFLFLPFVLLSQKKEDIKIHISTYLGNEKRNLYGNKAPEKLDTIWKFYLGKGLSFAYGYDKEWVGAGWTGQPLVIEENGKTFLIQGAFDYHLRKIDAQNGSEIWRYKFDDILKGTPTIWVNNNEKELENKYVILQGSRFGFGNKQSDKIIPSFRAVSMQTGKELWRMNTRRTVCYSRDVDGSALIVNDTAYLALENAIFTIFDPDFKKQELRDDILQPKIFKEIDYYHISDTIIHGTNIECESSPTLLGNRIYTNAGVGKVFGYNLKTGIVDWIFDIGADLNGSSPATFDDCLLIPVEKDYIEGRGGVLKLNPSKKPENAVEWYFPTPNKNWFHWKGGIVGSIAVNDATYKKGFPHIAAFIDAAGFFYVIDQVKMQKNKKEIAWDNKTQYPVPVCYFEKEVGPSIATPIIVGNKIIVPLDKGLQLYEFDKQMNMRLIDEIKNIQIDATPVVWNGFLYIASLDGYLYCFGKK